MDGNELAGVLEKLGVKIKNKTKTSVTVFVDGNRIEKMKVLANSLSHLGATVDNAPNSKSSIGGVVVGKVLVIVKTEGRTGGLDVEAKAIDDLNDACNSAFIANGGPFAIRCGNRKITGAVKCVKTAGTPKSDFHLVDSNNKPIIHISHKAGSKPNDFQQWGGVTEKRIVEHKDVQTFIQKCKALYGSRIPNGQSAFTKIKDISLANMSIFGVNFDKGQTDPNRADVLIQGDPGLNLNSDGTYSFTGTGHVNYLGDKMSNGFEPVLAIIYKGDRSQFDIGGARFSIYPADGRKFKTEL